MDWLDLLAVQGTFKSLLQHHSSKASILWRSAFFIVQLSYPYKTPGKTIALTRRTFVDKVMSLLFNMLSKSVIRAPESSGQPQAALKPCRMGEGTTFFGGPLSLVTSLVTEMVKNLPAMRETRVSSLGRDDPLEKGTATHSRILPWKIPWTEKPGGL